MDAARREHIDLIALEAVTNPPSPKNARGLRHNDHTGINQDDTATSVSDRDSPSEPEPIGPDEVDAMVGCQIGPYHVVARIGGGGIGNVYRATRDEEFAQQVA